MSLLLTVVGVPYVTPSLIAVYRRHRRMTALFLVNLLLGWTVIGWIAAMVWAFAGEVEHDQLAARGDRPRPRGGLALQGADPRLDETPARPWTGA